MIRPLMSDTPGVELLRSQHLQKKRRPRPIRDPEQCSNSTGKDSPKLKSQRGGGVDVVVKHKVHWPHEAILGGVTCQQISYDQLSLTQWVQGFCKNILEQKLSLRRDSTVAYLGDLMEDAIDFLWQGLRRLMPSCSVRWSVGQ